MAGIGKEEEMAAQEKTENKEEKMDEGGGEDSEGDVYEVEKIVGMSAKEGKTVYRVRWQGYSPSWDTWEPYENLVSCRDMIDAYMDDLNKKKSPVKVQTPDFNPEVFSQEESSDHDSIVSKGSSTTSSANSRKKKEKKQTYYYVPGSDDEADTLKDKFWRDLEQGKINVFGNDLYSKVKSQGRAARPATFRESSQEMLPPEETPDKPAKKLKRQDSKGSGSSKSGKTHKRQSSGDSHPTKASAGKGKGKGKKSRKSSLQDKNVEFGEEESEVQEHVSVDEWLISSDNEEETNTKSSHVVPAQPDTSGRSVPQPDTSGRSVPQPDTSGRSVPQPDTSGRPVPQPDTSGRSVPQPDTSGRPVPQPDTSGRPVPQPDTSGRSVPQPDTSGRSVPQPDTNSKQVKLEPTDSQVGCVKPTPIPDKPTALSVQYKSKRTASRREMSSEMSSVSDMVVYSEPPTSPVHCTASSARDEVAMTITSPPGGNVCAKDNVCKKWLDNDPKLRSCVVVLEKVAWHKIAARMAALSTQDSGDECTSEQKSHDATPAGSGDRSTLIKLRARSSGWAIVPASEEEHIVKLKETSPAEVVTTASMVGSGSRTQSGGTQSTSTTMGSNGQQQQRVLRRRQSSGAVQAPITAATAPAAQPNHNLSVCQISVNAERSKVRDEISEIKMDVNSNQNVQADHNKRKSDTDSESQKRVRTDAHSDKFTSEKKVDNESNNEGKALQDKKVTRGDSKAAMNKSSESQKSPEVSYQVTNYKALFRQQGQVAGRQPELPTKQDLPREPTPRISSQHTPVASTAKDSPAPSCSTPGVENPYNDVDMRRMPVSGSDLATPLQRLTPATSLQSSHPPQQSPAVQGRPSSVTSLHSHSPQQSPVVQGRPSSVTSLHSHSPQQSPVVQGRPSSVTSLHSHPPQQSPVVQGRPSSVTSLHSHSPQQSPVVQGRPSSVTSLHSHSPQQSPVVQGRPSSVTSLHSHSPQQSPVVQGRPSSVTSLHSHSPQQSPVVQGRPSSVTSLHSHSPQQSPVVQGRPSSVTSLHSHSPQQSPAVQGLYSLSPQQSPTIHGRPSSTTVPHSQSPASVEVASLTQRSVGSPAVQPTLHQRSNSLTSPHTPLTPITPGMGGEETFDFDLDDLSPGIWDKRLPDKRQGDGTEYTNTDLKKAIWENNYELVRRAFSCGKHFDVEQPDNIGLTLLMVTAQCGFDDVLELLVLNGANINARTKNGATALMLACEQGHRCTVELLLTMGAHMNLQQANGETALIKAVKRGNGHVVRILLDNGVNFTCNHSNGTNENTAIKLAQQLQLPEVTEIINAHMSRVKSEFESQVYITLNNTAKILYPLFPIHCFAVSEGDKFTIHFHHDLQPTRQGVGMLLFIAHARITSSEIKCRFYGPCAVNSSSLNGIVLHPLTEEANFVMSFTPLQHGRNTVDIYTAGAPRSKAKLIVCAYKAQLTMPPD